ncbi:MAG: chorismate mutase [Clostridiales bacterium]|nr:chorismate mutase [Clostridiales bacterium]
MKEIEKLREQIDIIDDELVELFEKRMELVVRIGDIKRNYTLGITDFDREKEIIKRAIGKLKNKGFSREIMAFLDNIIGLSKTVQQKNEDIKVSHKTTKQ